MHAPLETIATWLLPATTAIVLHDVVQSTIARWMGDDALIAWRSRGGALHHIDPLGSVAVPLALAFAHAPVFGWGRRMPLTLGTGRAARRRLAAVALAGPVGCLGSAVVGAIALGALVAALGGSIPQHGLGGFVAANLFNFVLANACMATFHLIPLPPFDIGRALAELMPERLRGRVRSAGKTLALAIVAVVVAVPLLDPDARIGERLAAPLINQITAFVLGLVNLTV